MKIIKAIAIASLLTACGGKFEEEQDLGTAEQAFSVKGTTNLTFGASTSASGLMCNRESTGQVCSMPASKVIKFIVLSSGSPGGTRIRNAAISVMSQLVSAGLGPSWSFTEVTDQAQATILYSQSACGTTGSANVENYGCIAGRTGATTLTETLPGTYQTHVKTSVLIDLSDIDARGTSSTQDEQLLKHAVGHALLIHMGRGARTSGVVKPYSRRAVSPIENMNAFEGGELCTLNSYVTGGSSFTATTQCGGD